VNTCFYDQVGGGLSERLQNTSEYSLDRHLTDLAAVYEIISTDKVILLGSSWGTTLASNYIARNPAHVVSAIFSAAAPIYHLDWKDKGYGSLDSRMTLEEQAVFENAVLSRA